jgi:hypothetical protein
MEGNKNFKEIIAQVLIRFAMIILLFFIFLKIATMTTPDFLRNSDADGVTINITVPNDPRIPIIKSYKLDKYESFSADKKEKISGKTEGRVEGDIPCVELLNDKNIHITFLKDDKIIKPDNDPKIEIITKRSYFEDPNPSRTIEDVITKADENNSYSYTMDRYMTQYERYIIEVSTVKIYYSVDGVDYVSISSINKSNAKDATDFSNNYTLDEPIPAEI